MARPKDPYKIECGERLRRFRQHAGYDDLRAFAKETGVTEDALSSWENGKNGVPPHYVQRLKARVGLTHEYIYSGDPSRLPAHIIASFRKRA